MPWRRMRKENDDMTNKEKTFFYDKNGRRIGLSEFVDYYSSLYYSGGKFSDSNSQIAENRIKEILKKRKNKEKFEISDVKDILAWKVGKIDHKATEDKKDIIYREPWNYNKHTLYGREIDIETITNMLNEIGSDASLEEYLIKLKCPGISNVYIITLRYFATGGEHPIYDQFAYRAIKAISGDIKNGFGLWIDNPIVLSDELNIQDDNRYSPYFSIIKNYMKIDSFRIVFDVPDVSSYNSSQMCKLYNRYEDEINRIFSEYKNADADNCNDDSIIDRERKIDQALWVYGHHFKN